MSEAVEGIEVAFDKATGLEQLCDLSASVNKSMNISAMNKSMNKSLPNGNQSFNSSSSNNPNHSLIELDKSVLLSSDLTNWTQTVLKCYRNQLKNEPNCC
eukprot:TRINITY_DN10883_c0_g1_i2.p1 TRINITY_DN10883_c0_g1~~TRINITY_DN10883_c0_g1_i2.p1  ORF type:complete len:100 (-),score=10.25 TRINITY_DN10883_c0_g1_i2:194-493(-)